MKKIDYYFFYKNSVRYLLMNKLNNNINNCYIIPYITKLLLFFSLYKLEDIDEIRVYNYLYLFKFFFGKHAFLTKYKSYFNLGKWTYSFNVCLIIKKKDIYNIFFFYIMI